MNLGDLLSANTLAELEKKLPGLTKSLETLASADQKRVEASAAPTAPADLDPAVAARFSHERALEIRCIRDSDRYAGGSPDKIRPVMCFRCENQTVQKVHATSTCREGAPYHLLTVKRQDIPEMHARAIALPLRRTGTQDKNKDYTRSFFVESIPMDLTDFLSFESSGSLKWHKSSIHGEPPRYYADILHQRLNERVLP